MMKCNAMSGQEMGNMSTLEKKVDALLHFCTATSEEERKQCYGDLQTLLQMTQVVQVQRDVQQAIDRVLADLGVPDHLLGYGYLRTAIGIVVDAPEAVHYITGMVYPQVAKRHSTLPQLVERSMRHAVECGWVRCDLDVQAEYFGGQIDPRRSKPTNAQFIARAANIVRHRIGEGEYFMLQN